MKWEVTFLITGFDVENEDQKVGNVAFKPSEDTTAGLAQLRESAKFSKFPFRTDHFSRAVIVIEDDDRIHAAMKALMEIDRSLDTFVFTWFGQSRFLPVGYVRNIGARDISPIKYAELLVSMPIIGISSLNKMIFSSFHSCESYIKNFEHLLLKQPKEFHRKREYISKCFKVVQNKCSFKVD